MARAMVCQVVWTLVVIALLLGAAQVKAADQHVVSPGAQSSLGFVKEPGDEDW